MKKAFLTLFIVATVNLLYAQWRLPSTGGTAQWSRIGTFTAPQGGTIHLSAYIHAGYNASNSQDAVYEIIFKTSNGSSTDVNGFAGNGSWYAVGFNNAIPYGNIKGKANAPGINATSFDLYIFLPAYTEGSHYTYAADPVSSWSNVGALGQLDPGIASSSVLIPNVVLNLPYGNVGIGMSDPDAKLSVNGTIHTREVKVNLAGWPDYVFTPKYTLPLLSEVKTYISRHQRLPEMPSEQEVVEEGLKLGEINRLLAKKIEELTLYLIMQEERIQALEAKDRKRQPKHGKH
jgi:hypothetical protein